jgi:hypothetical protein
MKKKWLWLLATLGCVGIVYAATLAGNPPAGTVNAVYNFIPWTQNASGNYLAPTLGNPFYANDFRINQPTYSTTFSMGVLTGDQVTLTGSSSKNVYITHIDCDLGVSGAATTTLNIIKRSTADTGGTLGTAPTIVPHASTNVAATATTALYSVVPTPGTTVGNVRTGQANSPTSGYQNVHDNWDFDKGQEVILIGTAQQLAFNTAGSSYSNVCSIEWYECATCP